LRAFLRLANAALAAAWLAAGAGLCWAQPELEPEEVVARTRPYLPRAPYVFRTEARLVEVGVVVRDRRNQAVSGLDRRDFEIREGGKRREIAAFSVLTFVPAHAAAAAQKREPAAVLPRGRFVGLLFDDLNSDLAEFRNSQLAAERFIKEGMAAGDQVAIFTTTQAQLAPFTADPERLLAVLGSLKLRKRSFDRGACPEISPYESYLLANNMDRTLLEIKVEETRRCLNLPPGASGGRGGLPPNPLSTDPVVRAVLSQAHSTWQQIRWTAQNTLDTIRNVVEYMAALPGTRMLLLASGGFLAGTLEHEQERIVSRALRGGVVINALDAKGLFAGGPVEMPRGGDARSVAYAQTIGTRPLHASNDALAYLSQSTGGRFFHSSNDLEGGFRELAAAPEVSYLLGFVPDSEPDGKFHKISVRVSAGKGYSVQARPGYFAAKQAEVEQEPPERRIDQEVLSGTTLSEAPVQLAIQPGALADGGHGVVGLLRVDVKALPFLERSGRRHARLNFIAALLDRQGNFVTGREGSIEFSLRKTSYEWLAGRGLTTRFQIEAPPGDYQLRLVAEEPSQNRVTALSQAVVVR